MGKLDAGLQNIPTSKSPPDCSNSSQVKVRVDVERQIGDIRPAIKTEIDKMGAELAEKSGQIQDVLNEFDGTLQVIRDDIPRQKHYLDEYGNYLYYIGFGMSLMVLLILCCYVLGKPFRLHT